MTIRPAARPFRRLATSGGVKIQPLKHFEMKRFQIFSYGHNLNGSAFFVNKYGYFVEELTADAAPAADALAVVSGYNAARFWRPASEVFRTDSPVFALFEKSEFRKLAGYGPRIIGGVVVVPVLDERHGHMIAASRDAWAFGFADGSKPLSYFLEKYNK